MLCWVDHPYTGAFIYAPILSYSLAHQGILVQDSLAHQDQNGTGFTAFQWVEDHGLSLIKFDCILIQ